MAMAVVAAVAAMAAAAAALWVERHSRANVAGRTARAREVGRAAGRVVLATLEELAAWMVESVR